MLENLFQDGPLSPLGEDPSWNHRGIFGFGDSGEGMESSMSVVSVGRSTGGKSETRPSVLPRSERKNGEQAEWA